MKKCVLVTGGAGGMGLAAALRLLSEGYSVFALDKSAPAEDNGIHYIEADVTSYDSLSAALEKIKQYTDELYAIVHFAGIYNLDSLVEMPEKDFTKIFDVNLFGAYRVNKLFLPLLKPGSRIVITTSELAPLDPLPFTGIYAITKSALDKYAYSLRMELQLLGISVAVMRPGAVDTGMIDVSIKALDRFTEGTTLYNCNAKRFKSIVEGVEARRVPAERIAKLTAKILKAKRCRQVYSLNKNPLLLLLNILPRRAQTWIIKKILN